MNEENLTTESWLKKELTFINVEMAATLNGRLKAALESCDDEKQEVVLKFPLEQWQVNGLGTLHGGMANTMMDLAMSMAVHCFSRQNIPPTISMSTNYIRPIPMEQHVFIRAKLTSLGKRNATAYCEAIIPGNGNVACTAIGTYAVIMKK